MHIRKIRGGRMELRKGTERKQVKGKKRKGKLRKINGGNMMKEGLKGG